MYWINEMRSSTIWLYTVSIQRGHDTSSLFVAKYERGCLMKLILYYKVYYIFSRLVCAFLFHCFSFNLYMVLWKISFILKTIPVRRNSLRRSVFFFSTLKLVISWTCSSHAKENECCRFCCQFTTNIYVILIEHVIQMYPNG